jgi:hypothetical protein
MLAEKAFLLLGVTLHLSSAPNRVERLLSFMWHLNEDCYEKRRRRSLFYTTVEAETLLQNNVRVGLWHLRIVPSGFH